LGPKGNKGSILGKDQASSMKRRSDTSLSPKPKEPRSQSRSRSRSPVDTASNESISMETEQQTASSSRRNSTSNVSSPTIYSFLLVNADPKFKTPKQVLHQLQKYLPRADIHQIIFTKNGIIIQSIDQQVALKIRNKVSYEIFGPKANIQPLNPSSKKQPPPPRKTPTLSVVIKGVTPDYTDEEITDELRYEGFEIKRCIRIRCSTGPTYLVRILSDSQDTIDDLLLNGAPIYRRIYRVEPSKTPSPVAIRCERCQTYNQHQTKDCPNTPICGHCKENHSTSNCTNLQKPPSCFTCNQNHPTYSYKCQQRPAPLPDKPELTVPIRTTDKSTAPDNSLKHPITIEDLLRFITVVLQNIHPFQRNHILNQITIAGKSIFGVHLNATYSGPYAHFSVKPIENAPDNGH